MLLDGTLIFDATYSAAGGLVGVNVFTNGSSQVSTNVLDLINARDLGRGRQGLQVDVFVLVTTAFVGGTSLNIQFQGSTDNTTYTTYAESGAIPVASLTLGAHVFNISVPGVQPGGGPKPRYYRLNYVCVGNVTAGAVIAALAADDSMAAASYASGFTVAN